MIGGGTIAVGDKGGDLAILKINTPSHFRPLSCSPLPACNNASTDPAAGLLAHATMQALARPLDCWPRRWT